MPAIFAKAKLDKKRADVDDQFVDYDAAASRIKQGTGIISDAASVFKPKFEFSSKSNKPHWKVDPQTGEILNP